MSSSSSELSHVNDLPLAEVSGQSAITKILAGALEKGVTPENVSVMERLLAMQERYDAKQAEREFAAAFVEVQANMPRIEASKPVPDKFGNVKYVFAPFEDIMRAVKPLLLKHGFTIRFDTAVDGPRIKQTCKLMHKGGHTVENSFYARIGSGPPGSSEAQGDGAASTYAKRFALCNALNIVIEHDTDGRDDARHEGAPITEDEVLYLKELVKETGSNEAAFLKFAGADTYDKIGSTRYSACVAALKSKKK